LPALIRRNYGFHLAFESVHSFAGKIFVIGKRWWRDFHSKYEA